MNYKILFLCVLFAFAKVSWGQTGKIVHTICGPESSFAINPEHPGEGEVYLDYDQDGETDHYIFSEHVYSGADCRIRIQGVEGTGWRLNAYPSSVGDTVSCYADSLYYWPWSVLLRGWRYNYHVTNNEYPDTYYSVRKLSADGYLYAWWRISIVWKNDEDVTLTVHEMAYCTQPGYPLRVGQTSFEWDIEEQNTSSDLVVSPNPTEGLLTVTGKDISSVEVYNTLGQLVLTKKEGADTMTLDLSGQPSGLYFISVTDQNGQRCVKKIVKQ